MIASPDAVCFRKWRVTLNLGCAAMAWLFGGRRNAELLKLPTVPMAGVEQVQGISAPDYVHAFRFNARWQVDGQFPGVPQ